MKPSLTLITALLVLLIAVLAGGTLLVLHRMQYRAAYEAAAANVIDRGHTLAAHLQLQVPVAANPDAADWARFSYLIRNLYAVEDGLQYVSVTRDGIVVFHEQTTRLDSPVPTPLASPMTSAAIRMRREVLQTGADLIPVVVFTATADVDGIPIRVEAALRRDIVHREEYVAENAIASMFRFSLLTVSVAFGVCIVLVVWMMRREMRHEALRNEQEHLAFSGMLANGIVHDFRNPMSSLKLDVQMLHREVAQAGPFRPSRIATLSERIRCTLDRMDEVFKAFLFASRPDRAEHTVTDAAACVRDAVAMLAPRFERTGIRVVIEAPPEPLHIKVFLTSLRRAIVNVLTNAIQFSPVAAATVSVILRHEDNRVVIEIRDQGSGIPVIDRKRVFDMFYTSRPEGTGLGLFLAKAAIERSNGTIAVVDTPAGTGTCIRIMLPAARTP